jgi:lipopolysaccharide biosynthesis glycosyltransferase
MKDKYIACSVDSNYQEHLFVMLTSFIDRNKKNKFHFFILLEDASEQFSSDLYRFFDKQIYNISFEFIFIKDKLLDEVVINGHVSRAAYYRILLPKILPYSISKLLYLDLDIVIMKDISSLWLIELNNYSHLGIKNLGINEMYKNNLGMKSESEYFNSGVMFINLSWWRKNKVYEKSLFFMRNHFELIRFWDQDVLNIVLEGKWKEMPFEFNAQEQIFRKDMQNLYLDKTKVMAYFNPTIIHYTGGGSSKPWFKECRHLLKNEYVYYFYKSRVFHNSLDKFYNFFGLDIKINRFNFWLIYIERFFRKIKFVINRKF